MVVLQPFPGSPHPNMFLLDWDGIKASSAPLAAGVATPGLAHPWAQMPGSSVALPAPGSPEGAGGSSLVQSMPR